MAGVKGQITRAQKGKRTSVYLSNLFGIWEERGNLHLAAQPERTRQRLHIYVSPEDGLLYDALKLLHNEGLRKL